MWHEENLLIDGDMVAAEANRTYPTLDPSTGKALGTAADASVHDAEKAVVAARRAFDSGVWSGDIALRLRCLRQLHEAFSERREDLRQLVMVEAGVPLTTTYGPGVDTPIGIIDYYVGLLEKYDFSEDLGTTEFYGATHQRWVEKEPVGVVAAIVPYNQPVQVTLAKIVPALAAGCTVVVKGPPQTPWLSASMGRIIADSTDIPPGVVNFLTSESTAVGEALVAHPLVDSISFTGSTAAGRRIMASAADTVKRVFLELGGKSAMIALDDADFDTVATIISYSICTHAGQGCAITSRLLLPQNRFDEVIERVAAKMAGIRFGDPRDPANMMGPLITAQQRDRVEGHVKQAMAEGGTVVTGGKRPTHLGEGYFFEPTLVVGLDNNASLAQQEVFGPVLVALPYRDEAEAIDMANHSLFGLSGSVFSADDDRATGVARKLRVGTASINGGSWYAPDVPFGGYKQSGIGREMGRAGLEEYLETKSLSRPLH
jgi:aldehyde dehydrogenase (NAD+)